MRKSVAFVFALIITLVLFSGCTDNGSGPVKGNVRLIDKSGKVWLTKEDFREITVKQSGDGFYSLVLTLTDEGRRNLREATRFVSAQTMNVIDIYVDDELASSPKVIEELDSDILMITSLQKEEAIALSKRIRAAAVATEPVPTKELALPEEKVPSNPEDIHYSGNVSIEKYVQSAKVELTLSKDMMNVTYTKILFKGVSIQVSIPGGTKSISIGSIEVASQKILPVDNGLFIWDLGSEGRLTGKIKPNGDIEGTLHYVYQGTANELDTFDFGEWTWSAQRLD